MRSSILGLLVVAAGTFGVPDHASATTLTDDATPALATPTRTMCSVPVGVRSCDDEMWRLVGSTAGCLIGAVGFIKAGKTLKAAGKALKKGGNVKQIIYGAVGAFFCTDVWNSFWDWRDCEGGMMDLSFLDSDVDPFLSDGNGFDLGEAFILRGDELLGGEGS